MHGECSRAPIALFDRAVATSSATSRSRTLSPSHETGRGGVVPNASAIASSTLSRLPSARSSARRRRAPSQPAARPAAKRTKPLDRLAVVRRDDLRVARDRLLDDPEGRRGSAPAPTRPPRRRRRRGRSRRGPGLAQGRPSSGNARPSTAVARAQPVRLPNPSCSTRVASRWARARSAAGPSSGRASSSSEKEVRRALELRPPTFGAQLRLTRPRSTSIAAATSRSTVPTTRMGCNEVPALVPRASRRGSRPRLTSFSQACEGSPAVRPIALPQPLQDGLGAD